MLQKAKKLVFQNGAAFQGQGFGADVQRVCEVVLNTAMVGYQEIFSDCSYNEQFVCMGYPLIGNYGLAREDYETQIPRIGGFIVREYNDTLANFRAAKTLAEDMEEHGVPGIQGVDTRRITRMIRDEGGMRAVLCNADTPDEEALEILQNTPLVHNQVQAVSCKKRWYSRTAGVRFKVVAVDCGIKQAAIRALAARGCNVTVVPYNTPAAEIFALQPDGLFLSSGPGNPADAAPVTELVRGLQGKLPIFGAGLGHQIIALARGCTVYKLKFGCGGSCPVKNLRTGKIEMTSQNNSYAVQAESVPASGLATTHVNVLDGTVEGLEDETQKMFSVQYHPESSPGPQDSEYLFDKFIYNMENFVKRAPF